MVPVNISMQDDQTQQQLTELNMSPYNLRQRAAQIPVEIGMEFGLCVPTNDPVSDQQATEDMSFNERIRDNGWSDQIMEFFTIDFFNSRAEIRQVFDDLESRFLDWIDEQFSKYLRSNQGIAELRIAIGSIIGDDVDPEDLESEIDLAIQARSRAYEAAVESMEIIFREDLGFDDFLDSQGLTHLHDIGNVYNLTWPYWHRADDMSEAIASFERAVQRKVLIDSPNSKVAYGSIEDPSIRPDRPNSKGLELMSPPLTMGEMLTDIKRIKEWADSQGCYTNRTCGLHINVSLPEYDLNRLDYVKLVLFLGDQYVLEQWQRSANTYTSSAMALITQKISSRNDEPRFMPTVLNHMKQQMITSASRMIMAPVTHKYTSVNVKPTYIEFRSAGGDYLEAGFDKILDTICRYVVALHLALHPQLERQEYAKKLYKALNPTSNKNQGLELFAQHSAGLITTDQLRQKLSQRLLWSDAALLKALGIK